MAAKTLKEALLKAGIKVQMKRALCIGPIDQLTVRIDQAEELIIKNIMNELRDFFAHQTQYAEYRGDSVQNIFDEVFKNTPATKEEN